MKTLFTIFISLAIAASAHAQSTDIDDYTLFFKSGDYSYFYDESSIEYRNRGNRVNLWIAVIRDGNAVWLSTEINCAAQNGKTLQARVARGGKYVIVRRTTVPLAITAAELTLIENVCE